MNLLNRARYPRRQAGQALVEFLAMAAPLLGLFLLMPMIGKYQDIAHATQMASRYAAFDATVHNDAAGGSSRLPNWQPKCAGATSAAPMPPSRRATRQVISTRTAIRCGRTLQAIR